MSTCPNCGAPGGCLTSCGSCCLKIDQNVGTHIVGQDRIRAEQVKQRSLDCFPE